jgi:cytochrome P450
MMQASHLGVPSLTLEGWHETIPDDNDARVTFELRSGESWRDPFRAYAALRDHDPVHYAAWGDFYVLSRFEDVWATAGDAAAFSSTRPNNRRLTASAVLAVQRPN